MAVKRAVKTAEETEAVELVARFRTEERKLANIPRVNPAAEGKTARLVLLVNIFAPMMFTI
jgi:hypothetical protein